MGFELRIDHCPRCGKVYQKNLRNLCGDCSGKEDREFRAVEVHLLRNRTLSTEQASALAEVSAETIRGWIRGGKLRLGDYPNLTDECDSCKAPIRVGNICLDCARRIKSDIAHANEQDRLMKERLRAANAYIAKNR